jgi:hypothetical protein
VKIFEGSALTYTDSSLAVKTTVQYRIQAVSNIGTSQYSSVISYSTLSTENVGNLATDFIITEIMSNPPDDVEFIEFKNIGSLPLDLVRLRFTMGIVFTFPDLVLLKGQFAVITNNATTFKLKYGFAPSAEYAGGLKKTGEQLTITDGAQEIYNIFYGGTGWPISSVGYSTTVVDSNTKAANPTTGSNWKQSRAFGGSPFREDDDTSTVQPTSIQPTETTPSHTTDQTTPPIDKEVVSDAPSVMSINDIISLTTSLSITLAMAIAAWFLLFI